jgi:hypothetical protein
MQSLATIPETPGLPAGSVQLLDEADINDGNQDYGKQDVDTGPEPADITADRNPLEDVGLQHTNEDKKRMDSLMGKDLWLQRRPSTSGSDFVDGPAFQQVKLSAAPKPKAKGRAHMQGL